MGCAGDSNFKLDCKFPIIPLKEVQLIWCNGIVFASYSGAKVRLAKFHSSFWTRIINVNHVKCDYKGSNPYMHGLLPPTTNAQKVSPAVLHLTLADDRSIITSCGGVFNVPACASYRCVPPPGATCHVHATKGIAGCLSVKFLKFGIHWPTHLRAGRHPQAFFWAKSTRKLDGHRPITHLAYELQESASAEGT